MTFASCFCHYHPSGGPRPVFPCCQGFFPYNTLYCMHVMDFAVVLFHSSNQLCSINNQVALLCCGYYCETLFNNQPLSTTHFAAPSLLVVVLRAVTACCSHWFIYVHKQSHNIARQDLNIAVIKSLKDAVSNVESKVLLH